MARGSILETGCRRYLSKSSLRGRAPLSDLCATIDIGNRAMITPVAKLTARLSVGKLPQVARSSPASTSSSEEGTPLDAPGAVAYWLGLVDRAQALQAQALAANPLHPVLERTARRALRSVLLYEHQITPRARRQARQTLWRRQHTGPLPSLEVLLRWEQCQCLPCRQARALGPEGEATSAFAAVTEQSA
jgi:hypothetical protein